MQLVIVDYSCTSFFNQSNHMWWGRKGAENYSEGDTEEMLPTSFSFVLLLIHQQQLVNH